ncbi:septal ring lytic transglycosylase RlpA family protein [Pseudopedobacter beijingensis]|uniref:Probable endolytic peptidoglycan transglycosylase RlpA n=1 Tax=Pseudopedobacter beijingensis TaxID=1207056 RepID=A0ABW4I902_9SPHI
MKILLLLAAVFTFGFSNVNAQENDENIVLKKGKATYYHSKFVGRKTTSGEVYRHEKLTAAHKTLPFGTEVTVTNPKNGKSVTVVINDRGPFSKFLMIDLSQSAAKEIGILGAGIASVEMTYELPGNKLANKNKAKEDSDI